MQALKYLSVLFVCFQCPLASAKPGVLQAISHLEHTNSPLIVYPTQFTQNIVPKPIHSHNDYWRDVPLLSAISLGVSSVEADVWLVDGELLVGHEMAALSRNRTFGSLYVQPLLDILALQNPVNDFTVNQTGRNGIFDTSSGTSLQLLVDMKTDGPSTLPFVLRALEPLRMAHYLTTFSEGVLIKSAITIVGTGNTPLNDIKLLSPRDIFFDAQLTDLGIPSNTTWDMTLAPLASTDYAATVGWNGIGNITEPDQAKITALVEVAHSMGIKARFWDTPSWPVGARNNVWRVLLDSGVDWLNADDLNAASEF